MAKVFLEGIEPLNFDTKDGKHIEGYNLHIAFLDPRVIGKKTDTKFISMDAFKNLNLSLDEIAALAQHDVDLDLNLNGKVVGISEL